MAETKAHPRRRALRVDPTTAAIGAAVVAVGAGIGAALFAGWRRFGSPRELLVEDHDEGQNEDWADAPPARRGRPRKTPLNAAAEGGDAALPAELRAPDAFRPDRDAPVDADKREAFAPAVVPVPSRVEAMGDGTG